MAKHISRRDFLRTSGLAGLGLAAACRSVDNGPTRRAATPSTGPSAPAKKDFAGQSITLLVYSGLTEQLYKKSFVPQFEARTGAKVTIDAAWTEGIARLQAAPATAPPFDLVLTDPVQGLPAIKAGLFQRFEPEWITNAKGFAPKLLDTTVWKEGYGLPFHSSAMTLATNTSLHPMPYRTWAELVTAPPADGVMLYKLSYMSLYTFAAMKAEQEGAVGKAAAMVRDDLEDVLTYAVAHRNLVKYYWPSTTDGVNALVQGNVAAGNIHGNGLLAPLRQGKPVAAVIPPGDVAYAQVFFAIPKNVRNIDLSVAAMDHVASREFQAALAGSGEYSAAIPAVAAEQARVDPAWAKAFPHSEADFAALSYYPYDALAANTDKIAKVWDSDVLRAG